MSSVSATDDGVYIVTPLKQFNREEAETVWDTLEPSTVIATFLDTLMQLTEMLQDFDPQMITYSCKSLKASKKANIPLFSTYHMEILEGNKSFSRLLQKLSPFMSWMDHSILTVVIEACNVPEAAALLKKFDDRLNTSQPVTKYPIPSPSHHMVPHDSAHTVLAVQLNLELQHSTLQNVFDTRSLIQEKCEVTPHCLQLLAVAKTSHTIIYWTIPKHVAHLIISNAQKYQSYLYQSGIQQVAVYPGTILATSSSVMTVGPFSFFTKVSSLSYANSVNLVIQVHSDASENLPAQLYQLEVTFCNVYSMFVHSKICIFTQDIPNTINKKQLELAQSNDTIKQLNEIIVQMGEKLRSTKPQLVSSNQSIKVQRSLKLICDRILENHPYGRA